MRKLPLVPKDTKLSAERFFKDHFLPLYPAHVDVRELQETDANPSGNASILEAARETGRIFAELAPVALEAPELVLDYTDRSVHELSLKLTRANRDRLFADRGAPGGPRLLVQFVIHGALYLADTIVRTRGAEWLIRNPLWESRVLLKSAAGSAELAPFSWLIRSLSDEGVEVATLADRYRTLVETPTDDVDSWPVLADPARRLPRLARVRYDLLYQHLRHHLEELIDFGADFPPPERFEELAFRWLSFELVGQGRSLLLFGPGRNGLHMMWMNRAGFTKSVFIPCDPVPDPNLRRGLTEDGVETLKISFHKGGLPEETEMLWWGP